MEGNQGDIIFFMLNTSSLFNIMKKNLIHSEGINPGLHASVQCLCLCMRRSSTDCVLYMPFASYAMSSSHTHLQLKLTPKQPAVFIVFINAK